MTSHTAHHGRHDAPLWPFLLLSLLLHAALLSIRVPPGRPAPAPQRLMTVQLAAPATRAVPQREAHAARRAIAGNADAATDVPRVPAAQELIASAKAAAATEAREDERALAAQERNRLAMPAGSLAQYMRLPHREIRLANGLTKIVTDKGSVCFQPVPYYARDAGGLYGIPVTCP